MKQDLRSACSIEIRFLFLEKAPVQLLFTGLVYDPLRILTVCVISLCFLKIRSFDPSFVFQIDPLF